MTARIFPKAASAEATPATVKPTIKKETVRIEIPAARSVPQATVKIQPAPVPRKPEVSAAAIVPAPVPTLKTAPAEVEEDEVTAHDPTVMYVSAIVLAIAVVNFGIQLMTFLSN